jgi:DMSO/TMAO reductase YedYZ molybdopterin-dependent catalytic subunit
MLSRFFRKPEGNERVPKGQTVTERFPVLTYGPIPHIDPSSVTLRVWGACTPREFSWDELMNMPMSTQTYDIHCVTHWSKLGTTWTGIPILELMKQVQLEERAKYVSIHSYGGYTTNLELADLLRPENLLAPTYEGLPLEREHGGPLRLVVPHLYFWKSAKWISGLEFLEYESLGFWERNGYHRRGDPFLEERYSDD